MSTPHTILKKVYGYDNFRPQQEEIINHVIDGNDALVIMPTGGGKSLCFQIPAICMSGICVVISPLIALMDDQVAALRQNGVAAEALHSGLSRVDESALMQRIHNGSLKLLYLSPERANLPDTRNLLKTLDVNLIAIDEAHCVSIWGNDFRPDYTYLSSLRNDVPNVPIIALTATADAATQEDIKRQLRIDEARLFLSTFERDNITVYSHEGIDRIKKISAIVDKFSGESGIIYCLSRKSTEQVCEKLNDRGIQAGHYHAGLTTEKRTQVQKDFQDDKIDVICATIAFGMGIDKPDIRYVVHYNMPKNIEGFYQEIGRAGRDGLAAESHLFYSWADKILLQRFVDQVENETFREVQAAKLDRMWDFASNSDCRVNSILAYFGEFRSDACGHCDNCLYPPKKMDGSILAQKALSAIYRTRQKVGFDMLIHILKGSYRQDIRRLGYDTIKTFGAGREEPLAAWRHYLTQFINKGLISIDYTEGNTLKWTPLSQRVIEGQKVEVTKYVDSKKVKKKSAPIAGLIPAGDMDKDLYEALVQWRAEKAQELKLPAYIVFGNKTLVDLATRKPSNEMQLLRVHGIGEKKSEEFGAEVLRIIRDY